MKEYMFMQRQVFVKKRDGKISIWYGGRLFKRGKDIYMQLEASNSEKYRKIVEERYWMSSEKLENWIRDRGFIKIK